ncbi:MAG: hypothetical protein ACRDQH_02505, partial [Pseudonocardiaceae bacterium]
GRTADAKKTYDTKNGEFETYRKNHPNAHKPDNPNHAEWLNKKTAADSAFTTYTAKVGDEQTLSKALADARKAADKAHSNTEERKAAADKACQGPAGEPGKDGAPSAPAPATPPVNQPQASGGNVIITTTVPDSSRDVGEAPAPQTVTSDLPVTH